MEPDSDPDPGLRYQLKKKLNINLEKNYFLSSNHIFFSKHKKNKNFFVS